MKTIVLGDIHGRSQWKNIIIDHPDADRVIFIGDYVDTHERITGLEQVNNLRDIIDFKQRSNKQIVLLIGNHDHHYWPGVGYTGTSCYQAGMSKSFEYEFDTYKDLFQIAFADEQGTIFSHAGVTETWLKDVGLTHLESHSTVDQINDLFKYQPRKFDFYPNDTSWCGDNIHQSPIWVRPQSLDKDSINNLQVVGHTTVNKINKPKSERQGFYLIDALGTSGEYLVIEDGIVTISKSL